MTLKSVIEVTVYIVSTEFVANTRVARESDTDIKSLKAQCVLSLRIFR